MPLRQIIYAPDPIFKQKSAPVEAVDDEVKSLIEDLFDTIHIEQAVGMAASMVGVLKRVVVIDMRENNQRYAMVNPVIEEASETLRAQEEASICYPYISAIINRPEWVRVTYLDEKGDEQTLKAEGFLASVVQHELDYLDGKVFLDYLSKMKRDMLLSRMQKKMAAHPPHIHGPSCNH